MKALRLILVFALLQCIIAFLTVGGNFFHEESMWHYIGRNWFRLGLTPYAGGVDNKSPLIFAVYGLSDLLFGLNFWFPRLLGIVCQSVGIYYLYKIAVHISGANENSKPQEVGIITITIYGLSLLWRATGGKYVSFTETYAITFLILAVYYYLCYVPVLSQTHSRSERRSLFLSGLMAGIGLAWRISAAFGISAILLHAISRRRAALVPFISGLITAIVALAVIAMMAGISLQDIYLYAFAENFGSGSTTDHSLGWKLNSFVDSFFYSELLIFYPLIAAYYLFKKQFGLSAATSFLTLWLILEFIGVNVPGIYARPHFKHLLPVMSLMSGIAVVHIINNYALSIRHVLIAIWVLFIPKVTEPLYALRSSTPQLRSGAINCNPPYPRPNEAAEKNLGLWIRERTQAQDHVLVAGFGARVQLYSARLSPSVYFNVTQTPRAKKQFMSEVIANKPAIIVVPIFPDYKVHVQEDLRSFIDSVAAKEYSKTEDCLYGYAIYRRTAR
ncbi:MAG TPA: glycosyltransferase family 39 protein [Chitinophagaceae bacterium]